MPVSDSSLPRWNSCREASKGRQVMMSPAEPPSSLAFRAELYSLGAVGWNLSLMSGCLASNAGMIFSCQIGRSSLRQLSITRSVACAEARLVPASRSAASGRTVRRARVIGNPPWGVMSAMVWLGDAGTAQVAMCIPEAGGSLARAEAIEQQHGQLDVPAGALPGRRGLLAPAAGDRLDDALAAVDELGVGRDDVDHEALVDPAELGHQLGREQVQRDLLRGAGGHAGGAGEELGSGVQ